MGRGIVHPVDDLGVKNEPTHPALLDALSAHVVKNKFDLKALIREIVNSESYQLTGTGQGTEALPRWFERAKVRPLSAEELLASMRVATRFDIGKTPAQVGGDTIEYFLRYFGEPTNGLGDFQGSLTEHLFLNHSDNLRRLIYRKPGNLVDSICTSKEPWENRVELLFLSVLNRLPKPAEQKRFIAHLTSNPKPEGLVEEAVWALLNCAEFRFNH